MLTSNASYDLIPADLFEQLFVDLLLDDRYLDFIKKDRVSGSVMQYRLLRYNLIFTKNLFNHVKHKVTARLIKQGGDFKAEAEREMKFYLDKIYERERIMRHHTIAAKSQPSDLPPKNEADNELMDQVKSVLESCILDDLSVHFPAIA